PGSGTRSFSSPLPGAGCTREPPRVWRALSSASLPRRARSRPRSAPSRTPSPMSRRASAPVAWAKSRARAAPAKPPSRKEIRAVEKRPDGSTHWVMDGPLGRTVEWDAETTLFEPNKRIGWHSREDSRVKTSGQVTFVELGTGQTQVNVTVQWVVPATKGGETLA